MRMGKRTRFRMEKTMSSKICDQNFEKNEAAFQQGLIERTGQIEAVLRAYLPEAAGPQRVIMEAMEYSLMADNTHRIRGGHGDPGWRCPAEFCL